MRVTNAMLVSNFMSNLNRNLKRMDTYQNQLASGKRFQRPSEDPVGITRSLQARTEISKINQYLQNASDGQSWLTQTETALMEINSLLGRAYELAVGGADASKAPEDRQAIAKEVEQLKKQLIEAANSTYNGRYIFGGYNTTSRPFRADEDGQLYYNGLTAQSIVDTPDIFDKLNNERIQYQIGDGVFTDHNINGLKLFGFQQGSHENNLFSAFHNMEVALNTDNQEEISASVGRMQKQQIDILSLVAEVGGKTNRLELVEKRLKNDEFNYISIQSHVEDVDHEKAIMDFKMAEVVYRSALSVGARIIQPTLVDFLR